ncbi:hypothetical protein L1887_17274 [Cichorium endivia]|nr:hypothetical protein L1887_17274 [Cichorium endivia]
MVRQYISGDAISGDADGVGVRVRKKESGGGGEVRVTEEEAVVRWYAGGASVMQLCGGALELVLDTVQPLRQSATTVVASPATSVPAPPVGDSTSNSVHFPSGATESEVEFSRPSPSERANFRCVQDQVIVVTGSGGDFSRPSPSDQGIVVTGRLINDSFLLQNVYGFNDALIKDHCFFKTQNLEIHAYLL